MSGKNKNELSDRMHSALIQIGRTGDYHGYIPSCKALVRRGLLKWVHGRESFQGYVLTDAGRELYEEHLERMRISKKRLATRQADKLLGRDLETWEPR